MSGFTLIKEVPDLQSLFKHCNSGADQKRQQPKIESLAESRIAQISIARTKNPVWCFLAIVDR
jgi:hypothetical protein